MADNTITINVGGGNSAQQNNPPSRKGFGAGVRAGIGGAVGAGATTLGIAGAVAAGAIDPSSPFLSILAGGAGAGALAGFATKYGPSAAKFAAKATTRAAKFAANASLKSVKSVSRMAAKGVRRAARFAAGGQVRAKKISTLAQIKTVQSGSEPEVEKVNPMTARGVGGFAGRLAGLAGKLRDYQAGGGALAGAAGAGAAGLGEVAALAGGPVGAAIAGVAKAVKSGVDMFIDITEAVVKRAGELKSYSSDIAGAFARKQVAETMADVREARSLGGLYGRTVDASTDIMISIRDALLPIKKAFLTVFVPILETAGDVIATWSGIFTKMVELLEFMGKLPFFREVGEAARDTAMYAKGLFIAQRAIWSKPKTNNPVNFLESWLDKAAGLNPGGGPSAVAPGGSVTIPAFGGA